MKTETTEVHTAMKEPYKNQVIISIGVSIYWISIVQIDGDDYETKELALVRYLSEENSLGFRCECVPINKWFDSAFMDSETVVQLNKTNYHLLGDATEGQIIASAIMRAHKYIESNKYKMYGTNENIFASH